MIVLFVQKVQVGYIYPSKFLQIMFGKSLLVKKQTAKFRIIVFRSTYKFATPAHFEAKVIIIISIVYGVHLFILPVF